MEVINYEKQEGKGSLNAFFTVRIGVWGLDIHHMCEFVKGDKRWVSPPSYYEEEEGIKKFYPYIHFEGRNHEHFMKATYQALNDYLKSYGPIGEVIIREN